MENESALDISRVEAWLRSALEAEGEDFTPQDWSVLEGSITLHLGDGTSRIIQLKSEEHDEYQVAAVTGSPFTFVLSEWTVKRLFRESSYFLKAAP